MSLPASVLVVGGGIAGWTAAGALRSGGFSGAITIVEAEPLAYDRPPLSKAALVSGTPIETLAFATPEECAQRRIEVIAGTAATAIAPGAVRLADGRTLTAEHVIVATGAAARQPDFAGADSPRVRTLRTYADVEWIRAIARPGSRVVVLGGGFIGAEAAASLRALDVDVVLADRNEVPGERVLGSTLAGWLHGLHAAAGVDVRVALIDSVVESAAGGLAVRFTDGTALDADLVIAGIGMAPQAPLPGIEHGDTVLAPADHWDDARLDGLGAAAAVLGTPPAPRGAPWFWSDRYGHHLEAVGRLVGEVGESTEIVRWSASGQPAAVFRIAGDRLVGAASIDDANTVRAARRIIDQGVAVTEDALRDPSVSLRDLLRGGS